MGTRATRGTRNNQPSYDIVFLTNQEGAFSTMDRDEAVMLMFDTMINPSKGKSDHGAIQEGGTYLVMLAMKDLAWKKALEGPDAVKVISSFHDERDSLLCTGYCPYSS